MVDYMVYNAVDCKIYVIVYIVDCNVCVVHYTVNDYSVSVVHCTVDCSIDRCVVSCTDYDFSSMISPWLHFIKNTPSCVKLEVFELRIKFQKMSNLKTSLKIWKDEKKIGLMKCTRTTN